MSIHRLFDTTWDQMYKGAVGYGDFGIPTDQCAIIVNRNVERLIWRQLIVMFDEDGTMCLVTSRYRVPWLSLTAYLYALEQAKRLRGASIVCNVAFGGELVTCACSHVDWLQRVAQYSSTSSRVQEKQKQQQPTPSGVNLDSNSPRM